MTLKSAMTAIVSFPKWGNSLLALSRRFEVSLPELNENVAKSLLSRTHRLEYILLCFVIFAN